MSRRAQIYLLTGLIILLVVVYFFSRGQIAGPAGVLASDANFQPLNVQEPQLRLDLLAKLRKLEYSGMHRNIFSAAPPPLLATPAEKGKLGHGPQGPTPPPPPPPVQVPAEFFGYASMPVSNKRVAFFKNGDDVLVVAEGDTFLNNYRLARIGNDSADVEEISTGRHATVPMVLPVSSDQAPN